MPDAVEIDPAIDENLCRRNSVNHFPPSRAIAFAQAKWQVNTIGMNDTKCADGCQGAKSAARTAVILTAQLQQTGCLRYKALDLHELFPWHKVNWLIVYPYSGMGDSLPPFFKMYTLDYLLALPTNTRISFEKFADALIRKTGLTWGNPEGRFATTALRGSIARMVIFILVAFPRNDVLRKVGAGGRCLTQIFW